MDCMHHPCVHRLGDIVHRPNNIDQWQTTSSSLYMHQKRDVHIEWVSLIVDCSHWPGYISQQQRELDKLFMHLMLYVNIWKATSDNGMQHHPRATLICRGMFASSWRYFHWPSLGIICKYLFASGQPRLAMANSINKGMHALVVAFSHWKGYFCIG